MKLTRGGILFIIILFIIEVYVVITQWSAPLSWGTVPITRLNGGISYTIMWLVWPLVGSIFFAVVMPRILAPLFLKLKGAVWPDYMNAYVDLPPPTLRQTRVVRRAIYLGLLTMGIVSILIYVLPPTLFLPSGEVEPSEVSVFHMASIASIAGLVVPIAVAMWSTGWSYRDASLVHYKIPEDGVEDLYEIEPIYLRFDSFLKGYAGFSSILFIINLVVVQFSTQDFVMALLVLYVFMHISFLTLPALYVHSRMNHMWLRKNLPKARRFTKSDVQILEE
ncbi:MAG: hypothetical protein ACFFE3_06375 [Candidatus Thorarchaeota archaeon]